MLDSLRSFAGSPIGIIVFGALIVGLLFFGLGGFGATNVVANVGGQQISMQEFADAYQAEVNANYGGFLTPTRAVTEQVPDRVVAGMVQLAAVADQAASLGMGVSDEAVIEALTKDPSFQSDGVFNPSLLENYLRQTGLTERDLIEEQRTRMLQVQLLLAVRGAEPAMPNAYQRILSDYFGEQRTVRYAILSPDMLEPGADPTGEDLATYFQENADQWQAAETRRVVLLELSPRTLADLDAVTDEEIRAEYDARAREAERRHVWQYIFAATENATAADRAAAVTALLEAGATFDELVANGEFTPNDLGVVGAGDLIDPAVAETAFAIEAGEARIITGRIGPTLVHVSEIAESELPPFEELADDIRREIAEGRTFTRISDIAIEIDETRDTGAELTEVGALLDLPTRTVEVDINGNTALGEPVEDLPAGNALLTRIFETDVGAAPGPVNIPGNPGSVWFEVVEINPPRPLELDEVRDRVIAAWREDTDALRLQSLAESVVALLDNDEPIEQIEVTIGITFQLSEPLARASTAPEGTTAALVQAAFGGEEGFTATVPGSAAGTLVVVEVAEIATPTFDPAAEQPEETETTALYFSSDMTYGFVVDLQLRIPVSVNRQLMYQIIGANL